MNAIGTTEPSGSSNDQAAVAVEEGLVAERSRLLPRVSFQSVLIATVGIAVLAAIGRMVGLGQEGSAVLAMASGVIAAIGFLALVTVVLAAVFLMGWLVAMVSYRSIQPDQMNGAGDGELPPQWVRPRDPVL